MRALIASFVVAAALLCVAGVATAGSFSVNPIRLEMQHAQRSTSLVVTNHAAATSLLQVRVYRWRRVDDVDELLEAAADEAPVVTPPLFKLAGGGGRQVIRIGFIRPAAEAQEDQWRVVVEEVPQPAGEGAADAAPVAINLRLRVSLPLFRRPSKTERDLQWQASIAGGALQLVARNAGSVTERLDEVNLTGAATPLRVAGPLYVFPGEARLLSLATDASALPAKLQLSVSGTPQRTASELEVRAQ